MLAREDLESVCVCVRVRVYVGISMLVRKDRIFELHHRVRTRSIYPTRLEGPMSCITRSKLRKIQELTNKVMDRHRH